MKTLIITLFVIMVILFSIYLYLEITIYKQNQKRNTNDDKLNSISCNNLLCDSEDSRESNKAK